MKKINLIFLLATCCFFYRAQSQEYSYKHYEIKDGLVGNNVYHVTEDKDGFVWFATETGVSRFDGTSFKNFTTSEGLPDNEVLKLFVDSKGKVWILPFKTAICYYYKGKIYNEKNDSTLRSLGLEDNVLTMFEDKEHNLFFVEPNGLVVLKNNNKVIRRKIEVGNNHDFTTFGGGVDNELKPYLYLLPSGWHDPYTGKASSSLYSIKLLPDTVLFEKQTDSIMFYGNMLSFSYVTPQLFVYIDNFLNQKNTGTLVFDNYLLHKNDTVQIPHDFNMISFINDSILFFNSNHGSYKYNYRDKIYNEHFLENEHVSNTFRDHEGNLWFTTLGNGLFRLYSEENKNIYLTENGLRNAVESVIATDSFVVAGTDNSNLYRLNKSNTGQMLKFDIRSNDLIKKVLKIKKYRDSIYILAEHKLYRADMACKHVEEVPVSYQWNNKTVWSFKDMDIRNDGHIYIATHVKTLNYSIKDQFSTLVAVGRGTAICVVDSGVYLGTLKGLLFIYNDNRVISFADRFPSLSNRITQLLFFNNKIWIGTNDEGVFCFDGSRIETNITSKNGLTGNLVRHLYADGIHLWVGTDRGLNKINISDHKYGVLQQYTISDGLPSNMINAVYVQGDTVYVGTEKGLSFFDQRRLNSNSICDLRILDIMVSGKERVFDSSALYLKKDDNNIRFDFVAISFRSEGNIQYYYKLSGIDTSWKITKENFLLYPTLPSGNYTLSLYAINKFGQKSKTIKIVFEIEKKLSEELWFTILMVVLITAFVWLLVSKRIKYIRRSQAEKTASAKKIAELEQQALKAQMNPHFIFNCLNSIQQYVIDKDVLGANRFISGFSKLIRQTLDNSGKQSITVAEEESFLRSYLDLEKSRFEDKFDYHISIDEKLNKNLDALPPMLLQPYIENCIRHGIMHKNNGKGIIDIQFNLVEGNLVCSVSDNGIGRHAASGLKGMQPISYQSKGTDLTSQRIMMINKNNTADIILKTEDLLDENNEAGGTKVTIVIPLHKSE